MPTYDYVCDACDHKFELFQSMSEPTKKKCPKCGKPKLRRLFGTGAAVVFKGSGFYQTDYRSESYKKEASADKKAGEGEKKSSEGKTGESKPTESKSKDSKNAPGERGDGRKKRGHSES